jgi:hypothetical protein
MCCLIFFTIEPEPIKPFSFRQRRCSLPTRVVYATEHCLHLVTAIRFPLYSPAFAIMGTDIAVPSSQLSVEDRELANFLQLFGNVIKNKCY